MQFNSRFPRKHSMFGHKTYFRLSENLTTLYECCKTCDYGVTVKEFQQITNLNLLVCKAQTDYYAECCSCTTVVECREKHDCCCRAVLDNERERKRLESKEREAQGLIQRDPELAELICKNKDKKPIDPC